MASAAKKGDLEVLAWLHDKYPNDKIGFWSSERLGSGLRLDLVNWLIARYPERYGSDDFWLGVRCGDLELVKRFTTPRDTLKKKDAKRYMKNAAWGGHICMIQWFSDRVRGGDYIPIKLLWCALRCGHINVIRWVMEQRPELLTLERLVEMHTVILKQQPQDCSYKDGNSWKSHNG